MRLRPRMIPAWPKLAWVATWENASQDLTVYHGPMVEIANDWCVEAVWAGDFAAGDFDGTDLVFGSGVRCRGPDVVFVSPGSTLGRLWYCRQGSRWHVSNSLPALLSVSGLSLCLDHDYAADMATICGGLTQYERSVPTRAEDLHVVYYHNLRFDGETIHEVEKPDTAPVFRDFHTYCGFLVRTARQLGANLADERRRYAVVPLASISSGYDSPAAAVIAREAGCQRAVTIEQSTSLWRGSDSGAGIARTLGISCRTYPRVALKYPNEEAIWAVAGRAGILNWTLFEHPEPLGLLFNACHGDKVWARDDPRLEDPFSIPSVADLGLCELRLLRGFFQCQVPMWGIRHINEIRQISLRSEMEPWTLRTDYDRPIPRRIVEQAGVPRGAFAVRKKNTSTEAVVLWPHSPSSAVSFTRYLRRHGYGAPPPPAIQFLRWASHADLLLGENLLRKVGLDFRLRYRMRPRGSRLLFQWANSELAERYNKGLRAAITPATGPGRDSRPRTPQTRLARWPGHDAQSRQMPSFPERTRP